MQIGFSRKTARPVLAKSNERPMQTIYVQRSSAQMKAGAAMLGARTEESPLLPLPNKETILTKSREPSTERKS